MKTSCLITLTGVFLLFTYKIQAQSGYSDVSQTEMMPGTIEPGVFKGTFPISKKESFSLEGHSFIEGIHLITNQRFKNFESFDSHKKLSTSKAYHLKSAMAGVQKCDSIIVEYWGTLINQWVGDFKDIYTYDEYGNYIYFQYSMDASGQWIPMRNYKNIFDAFGNGILSVENIWDQTNSQWSLGSKQEWAFDGYGNRTFGYRWFRKEGRWVGEWKGDYNCNAYGRIINSIEYMWDNITSQWINYQKNEKSYDRAGNITLDVFYHWDKTMSTWVVSSKSECGYNTSGNKTWQTLVAWDITTNQFYYGNKYEYILDDKGNITILFYYFLDLATGQWVPFGKSEYTYDEKGNATLNISYLWETFLDQWVVSTKSEATYDSGGNLVLHVEFEWDKTISQWVAKSKWEARYDSNGNLVLHVGYVWDGTTRQLIPSWRDLYYYSEHNFIPVVPETPVYAYPNPASEYILFDLGTISKPAIVQIFDNLGRKVLEQDISQNRQINVSKFAGGLYLYRLNFNGKVYKGKILVE